MHRPTLLLLATAAVFLQAGTALALSEPTIDRITFTGNLPASESALLRGSGLHEGVSIFMVTSLQVREAVRANLKSIGFLDGAVEVVWPRWGSETYEVVIGVEAGSRTTRGAISIQGDSLFSREEIENLFPVDQGEPVSPADTAYFRRAVLGRYSARGYLRATATVALADFPPDTSDHDRGIAISIQRGDLCYFGGITVQGNQKVRDEVVIREFDLTVGEPMNLDKMREGLTSLYGLGLFSGVQIDYPGLEEGRDTIQAVVSVTEQDYVVVDLASGYISPEAVFGSVFWTQPNIMGNNQKLQIGGMYTRYISGDNSGNEFEPQAVYEEPWFLSTRWHSQLKLDYYYLQRDYQQERSYGGEIGFSRQFADVWRYNCGYRIERLRFRSTQADSSEIVQDWVTSARISSGFTRDTRTPLLNPAGGSWFKIAGSVSGELAGGSIDFYTVDGEYRLFFPVNRRLVLAGRAAGSVALGYSGNTAIPPNDRLYLGGGTTVRGYDFQTLGPEDDEGNPLGGNVMALGNIEARLRVWGGLGAVLFADGGGIWTELQQISSGTAGFGAGIGIRYDTPIGPVRLDYGFAPTWSNSLKRGKVYFAIGQAF
ncbi:MAG TPA: BamA/TamA family outer membrane protein [Candidatus Sabulitectum sp.]|mgnify:CR=1 FL=1|nr:BamA/TamA family outer membrane protein [Candidatus Sabulitectum sp.]HPR21054.1 BamA/TamA family outer membrane protein [Candidatus Sabulitectum sp.]